MRWNWNPRSGRGWPGLTDGDFGRVDFLVGPLAEHAADLGEPYARHLGGKVRELRFHLLRQQTRVAYWLEPGLGVILLTVFRKTRDAETAEVARALALRRSAKPNTARRTKCSTGR
jgi:phage-related protein